VSSELVTQQKQQTRPVSWCEV